MNSYELTSIWFQFAFENPEKIKPGHHALYFWCIELCNSLGWKEKFGLPTQHSMEVIGIKNYKTYIDYLNDLIAFGYIELIQKSNNQYTSNIIALVKNNKATTKAYTKALSKQLSKQCQSNYQSSVTVDKPLTNKPLTNKQDKQKETFSPPSSIEVCNYFKEKGYSEVLAKKAFDYYHVSNWKDSKGTQVKNWKQKMISVWFKEENKVEQNNKNNRPPVFISEENE